MHLLHLVLVAVAVTALSPYGACSSVAGDYANVWVNEGAAGVDAPPTLVGAKSVEKDGNVVMFGGLGPGSAVTDLMYTFVSDTQEWELEVYGSGGSTPSPRFGHAMAVAPSNPDKLYVFSGCSAATCDPANSATNVLPFSAIFQTYSFAAKEWTTSNAIGSFVSPRSGALIFPWIDSRAPSDPNSEYFVVFGGYSATASKRDKVYLFQVATSAFIELPILSAPSNPPALADAAGTVIGDDLYVWGGHDYVGASYSNTLYKLNLLTNTWSILSAASPPSVRAATTFATLDATSLFVSGGFTGATVLSDSFVLNVTASSRTWVALAPAPPRASAASSVVLGNVFAYGGLTGSTVRASATPAGDGVTYFARPVVVASAPAGGKTCAQAAVNVTGRMFANTPGLTCFFDAVASPATFVSPTLVTCPAAIPVVQNSVSAVAVTVGRVAALPAAPRPTVTYLYSEDVSSKATTAPIGLPASGVAGNVVPFQIQTRAACGIERLTPYLAPPLAGTNDVVTLSVSNPSSPAPPYFVPVAFSAAPTEFGRYNTALNTTTAATYILTVFLNGEAVTTTPLLTILPALPDATAPGTFVTPPAASTTTAGALIQFGINAVDSYGNVVVNPNLFTATATRAAATTTLTATIVSNPSGGFVASFPSTTVAGDYTVTVRTAHNAAVIGSFAHTIAPAAFSAALSTATGGTILGRVAEDTTIYVQPRDIYSNPKVEPGLAFTMTLLGSAAVNGVVTENAATGLYEATYTATKIGQYSVDIKVGGVSIADAPFSVTIQVGTSQSVSEARAFGSGLSTVVAGKNGFFIVQSRDRFDNLVPFGGLNLTVTSSAISESTVVDRGDGSYAVTYKAKHLGHFGEQKICVAQYGVQVSGSPFTVEVEYGVVFFVIVFFAVLIAAVAIAVACTWAFNKAHRHYQYKVLMRNPDKVFPAVDNEHAHDDDPWIADPDWANGGGVPLDDIDLDVADADGAFDVNDLVDDFHDDDAGAAAGDDHLGVAMTNIAKT